jgi:hypothetical protein
MDRYDILGIKDKSDWHNYINWLGNTYPGNTAKSDFDRLEFFKSLTEEENKHLAKWRGRVTIEYLIKTTSDRVLAHINEAIGCAESNEKAKP